MMFRSPSMASNTSASGTLRRQAGSAHLTSNVDVCFGQLSCQIPIHDGLSALADEETDRFSAIAGYCFLKSADYNGLPVSAHYGFFGDSLSVFERLNVNFKSLNEHLVLHDHCWLKPLRLEAFSQASRLMEL